MVEESKGDKPEIIIGIDLGTTNSVVAVYKPLDAEGHTSRLIIQSPEGPNTIPSIVTFKEEKKKKGTTELVGDPALKIMTRFPEDTFFDAKRLLGKKFKDRLIQDNLKVWPFNVVANEEGRPVFQRKVDDQNVERHRPIEISARVLEKIKKAALDKLKESFTVKKCVVTVPAYFNDEQRAATVEACDIAGLECVATLEEPTAAALSHARHFNTEGENKTLLIFDFGGGTLDVTILKIEDSQYCVLATTGDCELGGQDIDIALVKYFIEQIRE